MNVGLEVLWKEWVLQIGFGARSCSPGDRDLWVEW